MSVKATKFGDVDADVLERLRESFDTGTLLEAVARIDRVRADIERVREGLLQLHRMAHDLIDGSNTCGWIGEDDVPIWELADGLSATMLEWPDDIDSIGTALDRLAELSPDPDDDDVLDEG